MQNPAQLPPTIPQSSSSSNQENNNPNLNPNTNTHLLEINLISAQNLKNPSTNFRRLQTYAVVYTDENLKLRTRIDRVGGENPTWNDKFIFRVSDEFLRRDTSAVAVDVFAVGVVKDTLLGSARFLVGSVINCFTAVHVRRPSGRFHGVLNVGAVVIEGNCSSLASLSGMKAIGYADMMGVRRRMRGSGSWGSDSVDLSDGTESTHSTDSSSASASSGVLRELNCRRNMVCGLGLGLGLGFQRKGQGNFSLSDDDINAFGALKIT